MISRNKNLGIAGLAVLLVAGYAIFVSIRLNGMSSAYSRSGTQALEALTRLHAEAASDTKGYDPRLKDAQKAVAEASHAMQTEVDKAAQTVLDTYLEAIQWSRLSSATLEATKGGYPALVKQRQESYDLDVETTNACEKEARQLFDKGFQKDSTINGQCAAARRKVVDAIMQYQQQKNLP
jgi:hypothetical protein